MRRKQGNCIKRHLVMTTVVLSLGVTPVVGAEIGEGAQGTLPVNQENVLTKNETKDQSSMVSLQLDGVLDKAGKLSLAVPDKAISDAVAQSKDAGTEKKGINIEIYVHGGTSDDNHVEVTLSEKSMAQLRENDVESFEIHTATGCLILDKEALEAFSSGTAVISLIPMDFNTFSKEAQELVGTRPLVRVKISSNGKDVTDLGKGKAELRIAYVLPQGEKGESLGAVLVDDKAALTWFEDFTYDAEIGEMCLSVSKLGIYGIGYKEVAPAFTDIAENPAKGDIDFVVERGILSGIDASTFAPEQNMTRGMFIAAVGRMDGVDTKSQGAAQFADVAATADYAPYVAWAAEAGVVSGTGSNLFSPDDSIDAEEVAVILDNYARVKGLTMPLKNEAVSFSDEAQIASWAKEAVKKMQMAGVVNGNEQKAFQPKAPATKAEVASVLKGFLEATGV